MAWLMATLVLAARAAEPAPAAPGSAPPAAPSDPPPPAPEAPPIDAPAAPHPAEPAADPPLDPVATFPEALHAAEQTYFQGRTAEAREALAVLVSRVLAGETVAPDLVGEAFTWLGEVQYTDGDPEAARLTFRTLLRMYPDTPVSPYHHPLEVVNLFELVRAEVRAALPPVEVPRDPVPAWVSLPLGVPQFIQGRVGAGIALGTLQTLTGTVSIATLAIADGGRFGDLDGPDFRRLRYGVQWPSTFLFYGLWAVGSADAVRAHRKRATVGVGPAPGGVGLSVAGGF